MIFVGIIYEGLLERGGNLNDIEIIELFWKRDESALAETDRKYRGYLMRIATNVLNNAEDGQETVNDTYLKAWNAIPPHKPSLLSTFLGKITRQLSIDRLRGKTREKRGGSEYQLSLDELCDCAGSAAPDKDYEAAELARAISAYLRGISKDKRAVFVWRYYFCEPIKEICARLGESESSIKSKLHRIRQGLKQHLESEGFEI